MNIILISAILLILFALAIIFSDSIFRKKASKPKEQEVYYAKENEEGNELEEMKNVINPRRKPRSKKLICPNCKHFPMKQTKEIISIKDVERQVSHIFIDRSDKTRQPRIVNAIREPQHGVETEFKLVYSCLECGHTHSSESEKKIEWDGKEKVFEFID